MSNPTFRAALTALHDYQETKAPKDMRKAFASDPERFAKFSLSLDDLLLDWSKTAVTEEAMRMLAKLATAAKVEERRAAMFAGKHINSTEDRAVLHTALRNTGDQPVTTDGKNVMPEVREVLKRMGEFATGIRSGAIKGATGKAITDIVNIGIGGSDLGPVMATLALSPYHDGPRAHFVSNIDSAHIADTLKDLAAETTLFIIASKTFTTVETMTNAETAREWIEGKLGSSAVGHHFAAVSTALDKVAAFGIQKERVFGFWDWVGGRYSLWSAIGLPIMIAVGPEDFHAFLSGGHAMDEHFRTSPMLENLPLVLGLVGYWHRVVCRYPARAVIPYDQRLARLPAYLQQLDMESNGKHVTLGGTAVATPTGPLVWGEPGTNGQHAFFQLLHQGTDVIPIEFIVGAQSHEPQLKKHQDLLLSNVLAQSQALMRGRTVEEAKAQLLEKGMSEEKATALAPHRQFDGNRPSITILYRKLDPYALGRLIALYEHRVFVEGALFDINSFDQWGVELGKELATELLPVIEGKKDAADMDGSTAGLVGRIDALRGRGQVLMARIKGILFDKDGTLIDFDRTWFAIADVMALKAARGARGEADRLLDVAGYDFERKRFRADSVFAAGTNADVIALWYPGLNETDRAATLDDYNRFTAENGGSHAYALEGVKDALNALHGSGYRLGVATNDSTAGAERTLSSLGMAQLFDAAYGYDAVANPKPAADTVVAFCDLTGLKPSEIAMVGDNRHDLEMARAGGCGLAIAVLSGTGTRETLAAMADVVIGSVTELPALLAERS